MPQLRGLLAHWRNQRAEADALYEALAELVSARETDADDWSPAQENAPEIAKDLLKKPRPIRY